MRHSGRGIGILCRTQDAMRDGPNGEIREYRRSTTGLR
jgi:hypothetical protein